MSGQWATFYAIHAELDATDTYAPDPPAQAPVRRGRQRHRTAGTGPSRRQLASQRRNEVDQLRKDYPQAVTYKVWRFNEATRRGCCSTKVHNDVYAGKYPELKTVRLNARRVFVLNP